MGIALIRRSRGSTDAENFRAHVRKQHRTKRTRREPGHFNDLQTRQRTGHMDLPKVCELLRGLIWLLKWLDQNTKIVSSSVRDL